ncbi:MAG: hypothetical protein KME29_06015 [Calothrix sp. FI2-JRJ7]|nr:hypothetical protein [Calothrix sp. FI2-JRJ7]
MYSISKSLVQWQHPDLEESCHAEHSEASIPLRDYLKFQEQQRNLLLQKLSFNPFKGLFEISRWFPNSGDFHAIS